MPFRNFGKKSTMKVLITGATGLIGTKLTKLCHDEGWTVHYLTTSKHKLEQTENFKGFYWNPKTQEIDESCFDGVQAIFHLAGATVSKRWTSTYKHEIINSRVQTTSLLYNTVKNGDYNIKQVISASAIGVYPSSLTNFYDENYPETNSEFLGKVVEQWEETVDAFKFLNTDVTKMRIGLVLANEGGALPQMAKPVKFGLGAAFGSGEQWQSWIHIDDLAAMFVYALKHNVKGAVNAVAPNPVTNEELTKAIAKQLNRPLWLPNIPKFAMRLVLGEMHQLLFDSQRVSSKKIENLGFTFQYHNLKGALEDLMSN